LRVLFADSGFRLPNDVPTLATVLKDAGYHTLAVHSAFPVSGFFGFKRGFDDFVSFDGAMKPGVKGANPTQFGWDVNNLQRRSDETTNLVQKHVGTAEEPFFLWIHYWDPHDWGRRPPDDQMPKENLDENGDPIRPNKALYTAEVRYMDSQIGRLFDWLREQRMWDDTLVVVVADHGQGLMDHGWASHRLLYQEQIRVPLLVRVPGEQQQPVVGDLVRSIDIFPTVLDYLGIAAPKPVSGRSLRALMEGKQDEPRIAFAEQINGYDKNAEGICEKRPLDDFIYMAADQGWKLIYRPANPDKSELYDLGSDPKEARNLYAEKPDEALRMRKLLAKHHPWVTGPFPKIEDVEDGAAAQQALEGLGYTGDETISDTKWAWTCPEHMDLRWDKPGQRCPTCNELPILIAH
jgi:arylsulfatase A-like enzyme